MSERENAIEKVKKLLAKATSNNENEAQVALLKAREMMAKHKLSEKDVADAPSKEVKRRRYDLGKYSNKRNFWYPDLATVVAENHCCAAVHAVRDGSVVKEIIFVGLGNDPDLAYEIFKYAVEFIHTQVKNRRAEVKEKMPFWEIETLNSYMKKWEAGYSGGFLIGLSKKYKEQFEQEAESSSQTVSSNELMVIMQQPQEVKEYISSLEEDRSNAEYPPIDPIALRQGVSDGYSFNPVKSIEQKMGE